MSQPSDESRVLVIYTGGTIGMLVGPQGYRNEPSFLTETLRCQSRFHDPLQDSLFSNSASVEGYRKWSNSGRSSPVTDPSTPTSQLPTLLVKSSRSINALPSLLATNAQRPIAAPQASTKMSDNVYETFLPSLVTPRSSPHGEGGKRIRYAILEVAFETATWLPCLLLSQPPVGSLAR